MTVQCGAISGKGRRQRRAADLIFAERLRNESFMGGTSMETTPATRGDQSVTTHVGMTRREMLALTALGLAAGAPGISWAAAPQGQLSWGIHVTLAPTWFDPA